MRVYVLLLFALFGGVLGNICEDKLEACVSFYGNQLTFPGNAEDLEALCPKLLSHAECLENYIAECGGERIHDPESFPKFKSYIRDLCEEDSTIREDIVKELPCLKNAFEELNETCHEISRDALSNYQKEHGPNYTDPGYGRFYRRFFCIFLTSRLACFATPVTDQCGPRARDIVLDAHFRGGYLDHDCKKDDHDELMKFVEVLDIDLTQKTQIGSILRAYHGIGTHGTRCGLKCLLKYRKEKEQLDS